MTRNHCCLDLDKDPGEQENLAGKGIKIEEWLKKQAETYGGFETMERQCLETGEMPTGLKSMKTRLALMTASVGKTIHRPPEEKIWRSWR